MQIWIVFRVARQIDGEYIVINADKAFKSRDSAETYLERIKNQCQKIVSIPTELGDIQCMVELGIHETKMED